jgi:amidase
MRAGLASWIAPCDAILTLPATGQAPRGLADTGDAMFCAPWSFLGVPAVSIPSGWSAEGLPGLRSGQGDAPGCSLGTKYRQMAGED